ncbi:hypothetical protein GCK32_017292 [Trichostrongylus colubriformis]|uniref:Uncharacterized protein n=1 Tax=Trichostrongylus colubriformis TaxID=6319 RepID=A0AAN8EVN1_TRICO
MAESYTNYSFRPIITGHIRITRLTHTTVTLMVLEGRNCYSCKSLKANCDDTKRGWECKKPHVTYFSTMDGCEKAVLTCKSAGDRSMKIETKNEDVLTEGIGGDKLIKCKNGRWTARDVKNHEVEFRTVRCLVKKDQFNREPY